MSENITKEFLKEIDNKSNKMTFTSNLDNKTRELSVIESFEAKDILERFEVAFMNWYENEYKKPVNY